jgi:hypothetical protein
MLRLGVQTAPTFAPRQYAFRNTIPLASESRFGVWICGFPQRPNRAGPLVVGEQKDHVRLLGPLIRCGSGERAGTEAQRGQREQEQRANRRSNHGRVP